MVAMANMFSSVISGIGGLGKSTVLKDIMKRDGAKHCGIRVAPTRITVTVYNLGKEVKA